jgi:RNA polymerase sigma-70 factor (ECF subfamily)
LVWNPEDAKDIISETACIAYQQFETINEHSKFVYYLFGIASNLIKKKLRRQKIWGIFSETHADLLPSSQHTDANMSRYELYKALKKIDLKFAHALVLFEISGFSIKEIAEQMGVTESAVKNYLKRGREKLAKQLTEHKINALANITFERSLYGK